MDDKFLRIRMTTNNPLYVLFTDGLSTAGQLVDTSQPQDGTGAIYFQFDERYVDPVEMYHLASKEVALRVAQYYLWTVYLLKAGL
ncbi:MAG: hypothetical protein AAFU54_18160 [Chloroflexota bacterium]